MGVPMLARQHPRARQRGRRGPGSPRDQPTDHITSLVSQMSRPRAPSWAGMPAVSFLVWEGELFDSWDKMVLSLQGPPCHWGNCGFLEPCPSSSHAETCSL